MSQNQPGEPMWSIDHIEETFGPAAFGSTNRIMRVFVKVSGQPKPTYVDVPYDQFTTDNVARLINEHVANYVSVAMLQGPTL